MGSFDEARKAIQDILAPELRGIAVRLDGIDKKLESMGGDLHELRREFREDLRAVEGRMTLAIEQAKREILLIAKLAESEQRVAMLTSGSKNREEKSQ